MLDLRSFKALSSDTRLDILKALDGKKMGLNDLCRKTQLTKATLHEHLQKLTEAELIKKKQRTGHKWVYYQLSWKGSTLLHPENNRVLLLFTSAFVALSAAVIGFFTHLQRIQPEINQKKSFLLQEDGPLRGPLQTGSEGTSALYSSLPFTIAIICTIVFIVFISISLWRYQKNKTQKL